jgi:hypothetical protein
MRALSLLLFLLFVGGCGGSTRSSDAHPPAGAQTRQPVDVRFAAAPVATLLFATDGQGNRHPMVGLSFALTAPAGATPNGNARIDVTLGDRHSEFVSRVGPRRPHCYDAAPIDLPRGAAVRPGDRLTFHVHLRGGELTASVPVRTDVDSAPYAYRPPGCAGRKVR